MTKIKIAIIGGAGYTGAELIRLLVNHDNVTIISVVSKSLAGQKVSDVFSDLAGECDLLFSDKVTGQPDLVFLCLPHGESVKYLNEHPELLESKIIDLGRDFRSKNSNKIGNAEFVYGLPELNKEKINTSGFIANPGCFATCIQLALLPLAKNNLIHGNVVVNATTGSTGAGVKTSDTTHFSWRQNNLSVYQPFEHPHNEEIISGLESAGAKDFDLVFIPQRGSFTRGILATVVVETQKSLNEIKDLYSKFYSGNAFVFLSEKQVDLKMAVNTNKCFIHLTKHNDHLLITSVIDNLLKGASGQAIQNMNLMFGFNELEGLKLKSVVF